MKVEIFSDVVCPWCAIGKRRFERALADFSHADEIEVVWRAFELDPSAPAVGDGDLAEHLAKKYGIPLHQALASQSQLTTIGAHEGFEFRFGQARRANTFDAHRLLHYALEEGKQDALKERLFRAYFAEGATVGDHDTLIGLAVEVGLDAEKTAEILRTERFGPEVRADEAEARALGISGVPFFVIDRRFGISGAQSPETILSALEEAWADSRPSLTVVGTNSGTCNDESCEIPHLT